MGSKGVVVWVHFESLKVPKGIVETFVADTKRGEDVSGHVSDWLFDVVVLKI